jgi:hypothetical protein
VASSRQRKRGRCKIERERRGESFAKMNHPGTQKSQSDQRSTASLQHWTVNRAACAYMDKINSAGSISWNRFSISLTRKINICNMKTYNSGGKVQGILP